MGFSSTTRTLILIALAVLTIPLSEYVSRFSNKHVDLQGQMHSWLQRQGDPVAADITPAAHQHLLRKRASAIVEDAKVVVEKALDEIEASNRARMEHPSRNRYTYATGQSDTSTRPLRRVTNEEKRAAAILAEAEAQGGGAGLALTGYSSSSATGNFSSKPTVERRQSGGYWMEGLKRQGSWPWGSNDGDFKVFRNVKDYGAKGDGVSDDTEFIRMAINDSATCTKACYGSTTKGAIIYFPAGTYLVSSTLEINYGLQVIGDASNPPKIITPRFFTGLGVFSTDKYWGDGLKGEDKRDHEYYINTANFYRQIRNFVIDISASIRPADMAGIHYQVSQATSLQNVKIIASTDDKTEQRCIFAENGSGGFMGDVELNGGRVGIRGGNQQFTARAMKFKGCKVAVELSWDWGWTWQNIEIDGSSVGFNLTDEGGSDSGHVGSVAIVDSVFRNTDTAILVRNHPNDKTAASGMTNKTGILLDNVGFQSVKTRVDHDSISKDPLSGESSVGTWMWGNAVQNGAVNNGGLNNERKQDRVAGLLGNDDSSGLLPGQKYFERSKPQYESESAGSFIHAKDTCKGDGQSDDTECLRAFFKNNAGKSIMFIDSGTYMISDTVTIPKGSRVVGEVWSQFAAFGEKFADMTKPRVMIRVGEVGDVGSVELQDLIFTGKGPTAGAVFLEWNIAADKKGSAGMWDCHVRVGGSMGSGLTSTECPPLTDGLNQNCKAGSLMMHVTEKASGYFENVWLWTADHDLDDTALEDNMNSMTQTSIYVARGILIESTKPTWMYGTSSEHSVFYQYQFFRAKNIVAGMIQTEQPYYQPNPPPPAPFANATGEFNGDPPFQCTKEAPCDEGWALRIIDSQDLTILGAGLYSWFDAYTQDCIDQLKCQRVMADISNNHGGVVIFNLITIGAENIAQLDNKKLVEAKKFVAVEGHPFWTHSTIFEPASHDAIDEDDDESGNAQPLLDTLDDDYVNFHDDCYRRNDCVDLDNPQASSCGAGYIRVGYDFDNCGGNYGKPICCKTLRSPGQCTWRGGGLDCNGRCHPGEVTLFTSRYGGKPGESGHSRCNRGHKAFCCEKPGFRPVLTNGCGWTRCNEKCTDSQDPIAQMSDRDPECASRGPGGPGRVPFVPLTTRNYCCDKSRHKPLVNCHWVGQGDCADVNCNNREVTLATSSRGFGSDNCAWGRQKSLCCTADVDLSTPTCKGVDTCKGEGDCGKDPFALEDQSKIDESEGFDDEIPKYGDSVAARDLPDSFTEDDDAVPARRDLVPRAPVRNKRNRRSYRVDITGSVIFALELWARTYPGPSALLTGRNGRTANDRVYRIQGSDCTDNQIEEVPASSISGPLGDEFQSDHTIELQYVQDLLRAIVGRILPSGDSMAAGAVDTQQIERYWHPESENLPKGTLPKTANSNNDYLNINDRLFAELGDLYNRGTFALLAAALNRMKGAIFNWQPSGERTNPVATDIMTRSINDAADNGQGEEFFLERMNRVIAIWRYLHQQRVLNSIQDTRRRVRVQIEAIEQQVAGLRNILANFDEFDVDYWETGTAWARRWLNRWIDYARTRFATARLPPINLQRVMDALQAIEDDMDAIVTLPDPDSGSDDGDDDDDD